MTWRASLLVSLLAVSATTSYSRLLTQNINTLKTGVVRIENSRLSETGTGFIVKINGESVYIVTAAHVVAGDQQPHVYLFTQQHTPLVATVIDMEGGDTKGLALLSLKADARILSGLHALRIGYTSQLGGGESVKVIGFPGSTSLWSVDSGSIKRLEGRNLVFSGAIREGNSGGPVIFNGQVVGLVTDTTQSDAYALRAENIVIYVNGIIPNLIEESGNTLDRTKHGTILLLLKEKINGKLIDDAIIPSSLSHMMSDKNLSVTNGSEVGRAKLAQLERNLQRIIQGELKAGASIPFAVIVEGSISTTPREPEQGIYIAVANGSLRAISTGSGQVIALEPISNIRGFGKTPEQAAKDALKNVGESISTSFLDKVRIWADAR
jgi:S1-C subfamily serine protease